MTRQTTLTLPFPPSVNALYSTNFKTKRRFESKRYEAWKKRASDSLLFSKPKEHSGKIEVEYNLTPPDKRRRDCFNYEKAVSDFLVKHGIIKDDSLIMKGTIQWKNGAPGVTVIITDIEE